jgi:hypothetical protein
LVLPVVAVLVAFLLQAAMLARDAVLVTHAAREGARAAAVDPTPGAASLAARASSGLDPDRLGVTLRGGDEPGDLVRVEVRYLVRAWLPLVGTILTNRTIASHATMRVE